MKFVIRIIIILLFGILPLHRNIFITFAQDIEDSDIISKYTALFQNEPSNAEYYMRGVVYDILNQNDALIGQVQFCEGGAPRGAFLLDLASIFRVVKLCVESGNIMLCFFVWQVHKYMIIMNFTGKYLSILQINTLYKKPIDSIIRR